MNFQRFTVLSHHVISKTESKYPFKIIFRAVYPKCIIPLLCLDGKYVSTLGLLKKRGLYASGGIVRAERRTDPIVPEVATQCSLSGTII